MEIPNTTTSTSSRLLTFTGLYGVDLSAQDQIDLGNGFALIRPNDTLLKARSNLLLSRRQFDETERVSCFFLLKEVQSAAGNGPNPERSYERFQNGLVAVQAVKPVETLEFTFQGTTRDDANFTLGTIYFRPSMRPGEWARMRQLDGPLISLLPDAIGRVERVMSGTAAEAKNAVYLLQMALEHLNPLVCGLFSVMGLEAKFDSANGQDFARQLNATFGASSLVFPDWNSPGHAQLTHTVDKIALHLYKLRSKIAHGVDLRKSTHDKIYPVDFVTPVKLTAQLRPRSYAALLSEAATYLLCRLIQSKL